MGKNNTKKKDANTGIMGYINSSSIATAVVVLVAAAYMLYKKGPTYFKAPDLQPLRAPELKKVPEFTDKAYQDRMLWGSYRSGLYFGMRTRTPKSLLSGLLWFDPDSPETLIQQKVRHQAQQGDKLTRYGWLRHDGASYGRQQLIDGEYNISLSMVKHFGEHSGTGGDWAVRITAGRTAGQQQQPGQRRTRRISLVMYLAEEGDPSTPWRVMPDGEVEDVQEPVLAATGGNTAVGPWSFYIREGPRSATSSRKRPARLDYLALPSESAHDYRLHVKELLMGILYEQLERNPRSDRFQLSLPNGAATNSDVALFQVTVNLPGSADFVFLSHKQGDSGLADEARVEELTGSRLTELLAAKEAEFDARFDQTFLRGKGGSSSPEQAPSDLKLEPAVVEVAKAALSNLLGSMGYFYGSSQVRQASGVSDYWPAALFTAVPSRSFFPRGFLWDEGFHQLLVNRWDARMSRDVIAHWLDLINANGWIPREQILGEEARQRVPAEFVVQDPNHANPPSLFLPIMAMARQLAAGGDEESVAPLRSFLTAAWPRLEAWYGWFNATQAGTTATAYRWHGRNASTSLELNPKTLTSGLDDYPRASHPSDDERHLDLRCWMALASEAMAIIGTSLSLPANKVAPYVDTAARLSDMALLDRLHYDEARGMYLDYGLHTEDVELVRRAVTLNGAMQEVTVREVRSEPQLQFVPSFGYVSLFPLLMRLLPADSPRLGQLLKAMTDPQLTWSSHGLRSLATTSSIYRKYNTRDDPPYWRGQVWININYLALSALHHYSQQPGPYAGAARQAHGELRANLLQMLVNEHVSKGYLFEQYDDSTGSGMGSHPFTGWTALVALIATDTY